MAFGLGFGIQDWLKETKESTSLSSSIFSSSKEKQALPLGAFSISLSVKDLPVSRKFYEDLGFKKLGGEMKSNYLIMKNGDALVGLFQGMFEGNMLTFNPGWDQNGKNTKKFVDVRKIQKQLDTKGYDVGRKIIAGYGPGSFTMNDPDGNLVLVEQHR